MTSCPHPAEDLREVLAARDAYLAARRRVTETRLALGRAIAEARTQGVKQVTIAGALGLSREHVRRYQAGYEKPAAGGS